MSTPTPQLFGIRPKVGQDGSEMDGEMLVCPWGRSIHPRMACSGWTWCWMAKPS